MTFKEFIRLKEGGGLFTTQGWVQVPGTAKNNKDLYLHQYSSSGPSAAVTPGVSAPPGAQGMQQPPRRMKKMEKK